MEKISPGQFGHQRLIFCLRNLKVINFCFVQIKLAHLKIALMPMTDRLCVSFGLTVSIRRIFSLFYSNFDVQYEHI